MKISTAVLSLSLTGLMFFAGCGAKEMSEELALAPSSSAPASAPVESGDAESKNSADTPTGATGQLIEAASAVPRKIIYTATVDLVSDNFPAAQAKLLGLVRANRGYIAETSLTGTSGTPRVGTWKIRVPETKFDAFMAEVVKLGELQTTHTDSQDVTAEFYDLRARISNKQVEEKRLIQHLQRTTAKLRDILDVERELSRVRGEIEQMQGRLRLLANLTSLTTITVTLREVKDFVAPKPATFGDRIARTFQDSLGQLRGFGEGMVLLVIAWLPWLVALALFVFPIWFFSRRSKK